MTSNANLSSQHWPLLHQSIPRFTITSYEHGIVYFYPRHSLRNEAHGSGVGGVGALVQAEVTIHSEK